MKLLLLFDQRFLRSRDGVHYSEISYDYRFFAARYLPVFHEVRILARVVSTNAGENEKSTEGPGVTILPLPDWTGPLGFVKNKGRIVRLLRENLDSNTAVVMIAPTGVGTIVARELNRRRHPFAVEVVGDPWDAFGPGTIAHPLRPVFRRLLPRVLRSQCRKAAAALYVTKSTLQQRYPCPSLSAGISDVVLRDDAYVSEPRTFRSPAVTLINVARMAQLYKGHDTLIEATRICVSRGLDIRVVLVGDGAMKDAFQHMAAAAGLEHRVCFKGALSATEVRAQLDLADLFVLPSRTEGLPRALPEAMARALPCIATSVGGLPELLPAEDLTPAADPERLALKLQEVVNDRDRLTRMSARNLLRAREYAENILVPERIRFYERFKLLSRELLDKGKP